MNDKEFEVMLAEKMNSVPLPESLGKENIAEMLKRQSKPRFTVVGGRVRRVLAAVAVFVLVLTGTLTVSFSGLLRGKGSTADEITEKYAEVFEMPSETAGGSETEWDSTSDTEKAFDYANKSDTVHASEKDRKTVAGIEGGSDGNVLFIDRDGNVIDSFYSELEIRELIFAGNSDIVILGDESRTEVYIFDSFAEQTAYVMLNGEYRSYSVGSVTITVTTDAESRVIGIPQG